MHPVLACLDSAERKKAFPRALRVQGVLDTDAVRAQIGPEAARPTEDQISGLAGHRKQVDPS
nr:hypothetical protein [Kibdelosporangium sp. MJ126-NF4]